MILKSFYLKELVEGGWEIGPVNLQKQNLFVGISGSGKTRTLGAIFNVACFAVGSKSLASPAKVKLEAEVNKEVYSWEWETISVDGRVQLKYELIWIGSGEERRLIVERRADEFKFLDVSLPKLNPSNSALSLLKEEDAIKPLISGLSMILMRSFQSEALNKMLALGNITKEIEDKFKVSKCLSDLPLDLPLCVKLYFISKYKSESYEQIMALFKSIFPTIESAEIKYVNPPVQAPAGKLYPYVFFKEKGVKNQIAVNELASGMQKVFAIIADVICSPKGLIYLVDEYENSLGVNAIDFLPELLESFGIGKQFLITTHHPYLINQLPVEKWVLFNRKGSIVKTTSGRNFADRYSKSRQDAFIQLINDPAYFEVNS